MNLYRILTWASAGLRRDSSMSSSSSRPPSENHTVASTEALPATPATAPPDDGTGTVFQAEPPRAATDLTEYQPPPARQEAADLSTTLAQNLSDRLASEKISRHMQAAGYKLLKPIGEGTYGAVWLAEEQSTGVKVAVKFFAHGAGQRLGDASGGGQAAGGAGFGAGDGPSQGRRRRRRPAVLRHVLRRGRFAGAAAGEGAAAGRRGAGHLPGRGAGLGLRPRATASATAI